MEISRFRCTYGSEQSHNSSNNFCGTCGCQIPEELSLVSWECPKCGPHFEPTVVGSAPLLCFDCGSKV